MYDKIEFAKKLGSSLMDLYTLEGYKQDLVGFRKCLSVILLYSKIQQFCEHSISNFTEF